MGSDLSVGGIRAAAQAINDQQRRLHQAFESRGTDPSSPEWAAWEHEAARFHERTKELSALIAPAWSLRQGSPSAVEAAIVFLESDAWCFRSGYAKKRFMTWLPRLGHPVLGPYRERLAAVLLALCSARGRAEFTTAAGLVPFADCGHLRSGLRRLIRDGRRVERSRALFLYTQLPGLDLASDDHVGVELLLNVAGTSLGASTLRWLRWVTRSVDSPEVQARLLADLRSVHPVHPRATRLLAALPDPQLTYADRARLEEHVLTPGRTFTISATALLRLIGGASPATLADLSARTPEQDRHAHWVRYLLTR